MRTEIWKRPAPMVVLGVMLLAGCAMPVDAPQGVTEAGDGAFTLATRGPTAAAAVERGLNQASQHCADQNRMIAVQSTRIERDGYNIAFRCLSVPGATGGMQMASTTPAAAPIAPAAPLAEAAPAPAPATPASVTAEPMPPAAPMPAAVVAEPIPAAAPSAPAPSLPPAARTVAPVGTPLPTAGSPLPPIAGSGSTSRFSRPTSGVAPSSFWQSGR